MRKIYLLFALAVTLTASANSRRFQRVVADREPVAIENPAIISTLPDGLQPTTMLMKGEAYLIDENFSQQASANGIKAYCAISGSDIYLGPLMVPFGGAQLSYIKGTVQDNVATFTYPCEFECTDWYGGLEVHRAYAVNFDGVTPSTTSNQVIKYDIAPDGSLKLSAESAGQYVGEFYKNKDGAWLFTGILQQITEYTPTDLKAPEIPAGVAVEEWNLIFGTYGYPVPVAIDGTTAYLGGLYIYDPASVMTGTLADGIITCNAGQLVGEDKTDDCFVYAYRGGYEEFIDPEYPDDPPMTKFVITEGDIRFKYDEQNGSITPIDPIFFTTSTADTEEKIFMGSMSTEYAIFKPADTPLQVNAPVMEEEFVPGEWIMFNIPLVYGEVNLLKEEDVYFSLYVDGELFTFEDDEFNGVDGPVTDLHYGFNNYDNIMAFGTTQCIELPFEGFTSLALQTVYRHDGQVYRSDITPVYNKENALTEVETTSATKTYYNLQGQRMARPRGLVISNDGKTIYLK